jgi:transcriptional regulator with XRE-family HTH domain
MTCLWGILRDLDSNRAVGRSVALLVMLRRASPADSVSYVSTLRLAVAERKRDLQPIPFPSFSLLTLAKMCSLAIIAAVSNNPSDDKWRSCVANNGSAKTADINASGKAPDLWKRIQGRRLKYLRTKVNREPNVSNMRKVAGVSESAAIQWETGVTQPDPKRQLALADYFLVSLDYLTCRDLTHLSERELQRLYDQKFGTAGNLIDRAPTQVQFDYGISADVLHG